MKLVLVEWLDSRGGTGWTLTDDLDASMCACWSAGWIMAESETAITVAGHIGTDPDQCCGEITIPRVAILRIAALDLPRGVKRPDWNLNHDNHGAGKLPALRAHVDQKAGPKAGAVPEMPQPLLGPRKAHRRRAKAD